MSQYKIVEEKLSSNMMTKEDMQNTIGTLVNLSYLALQNEDIQNALIIILKLESTTEIIMNHGDDLDPKIILFILHNIS